MARSIFSSGLSGRGGWGFQPGEHISSIVKKIKFQNSVRLLPFVNNEGMYDGKDTDL